MKDFTKISGIYNQRNYSVSSNADDFDIYENDYAPADYIERELGKTIKDYNYSPGVGLPTSPLLIVSIILWIPATAGLAWVYESVGREAGIIVTIAVALCWNLAKNLTLKDEESVLNVSFSFHLMLFLVLVAVNSVAQFYRLSQLELEQLISNLDYIELLFHSSFIPAIGVMTLAELWRFLFVDRLDEQNKEDLGYYVAVISPQSEFQRGRMQE